MNEYTVGQAAKLASVSVRTLHHYDQIDLVKPSARTFSGYRTYSDDDVERLRQVMVYRNLGFSLEQIATLLDDPSIDAMAHLERQRELIEARIDELHDMVVGIEKLMEAKKLGTHITPEEMKEVFGDEYEESWTAEAEQLWGETDSWKQSQQRQANMSKEDWVRVKAEGDALTQALAEAKRRGVEAGSDEANALAERHRESLNQWYDCSHDMQVKVAQWYVSDGRFTNFYDQHEPGLAQWTTDIIVANAIAAGGN